MTGQASGWYFLDASGLLHGPHDQDALLEHLRAGRIHGATPVWSPGMADWQPLATEFPGAAPLMGASAPPPVATTPAGDPSLSPGLHPWRRFFAKQIDLVLFVSAMIISLVLVAELAGPELADGMVRAMDNQIVASALVTLTWMAGEVILLSTLGTTPGRALYGIRLRMADGSRLPLDKALSRTGRVAVKGLGLNFPLIALIAAIVGLSTLEKKGQSSWDADTGTRVSHLRWSPMRATVVVVATLLLFALFFYAMLLAE